MKLDLLSTAFNKLGATTAMIAVWSVAVIIVLGAMSEIRHFADVQSQSASLSEFLPNGFVLREQRLQQKDYEQIAAELTLRYPQLNITASRNFLEIRGNDVGLYNIFTASLFDLMALRADVRWSISSFCAGGSCNGPAYRAELMGNRQRPELQ